MFVYLIKCINKDGFIKIGVARNVQSRLETMQTGCPYELKILASIKCMSKGQAYGIERSLHYLFGRDRVRGEWFRKVSMKKAHEALGKEIIRPDYKPPVN